MLALLAAAAISGAAAVGAAPHGARPAGPACAAAPAAASAAVEARRTPPEAARPDRVGVCATDFEAPADLGLPRAPTEAPGLGRAPAAAFRHISDVFPSSAPGGSPLRPPRIA